MACFDFRFKRKMNYRHHVVQIVGDIPEIYKVKIYSYNELRTATNNFSSSNKIGQGGFGSVYKGKLKNGLVVALKVLSSESQQGVKEFLNELSAISSVMHENLVILYGCCLEQDQRILVYKYLPNNSLAQTLLGGTRCNINFSWQIRSKICIGVARGLAFLHEERIVHRDIKASNILLDKDLTPKISDFGLAKLFPPNMTHVSTRVAGTLGYLAPEYAIRGQLTKKADIYSFGVLLIEIVSGRCNTSEELFLLEKAWVLYEQDKLSCLVDPSLNGNFNSREVCRFLKVGLLCTQDTPKIRPAMSKVVKMLIGQIDADVAITKPGLISDFMDLKIRTHDTVELNLSNESPSNSGNSTNMPCSPYIGAEK